MTIAAFPLAWPLGWPHTRADLRRRGWEFKEIRGVNTFGSPKRELVTFDTARRKLRDELARLGARDVVLSTNIPLRTDGEARADAARYTMKDPGVAIYFKLKDRPMVM